VLRGVTELLLKLGDGPLRHGLEGEKHIVGMKPVWIDVHTGLHARCLEVFDVGQRFAVEWLNVAHEGVGWR